MPLSRRLLRALVITAAVMTAPVGAFQRGARAAPLPDPINEMRMRIALAGDTALYYRWYPEPLKRRPDEVKFLASQLTSNQPALRAAALVSIGRLQTPENIPLLLNGLKDDDDGVRIAAAHAIAQALHNVQDETVPIARAALAAALEEELAKHGSALPYLREEERESHSGIVAMLEALGSLKDQGDADDIENTLVSYLPVVLGREERVTGALVALESFTRQYPRRTFHTSTLGWLRSLARPTANPSERNMILAAEALVNARDHDSSLVDSLVAYHCPPLVNPRDECGWPVRRLGVLMIDASDPAFTHSIDTAWHDVAYQVRWEVLPLRERTVTIPGSCRPLVDAFTDVDPHVVMRALDLLKPSCAEHDEIAGALIELASKLDGRTAAPWQAPTHALLALAKFSPEAAARLMRNDAVTNDAWQVRAAAAQVAADVKDPATALVLIKDANPNVQTEALTTLKTLKSDRLFAATTALIAEMVKQSTVPDNQLAMTAAGALKGLVDADQRAIAATSLLNLLDRMTGHDATEWRDTSRDGRLAVIDALTNCATFDIPTVSRIEPYLRDFDPRVAEATADAMKKITGNVWEARPVARDPEQPSLGDLMNLRRSAAISLSSGQTITMTFDPDTAPMAVARFQALVAQHYYDGLTFHRVVTNFVIQGGSPDANEYQGAMRFARDEPGGTNVRGAVGLSTRGLDTADMQFFIDLTDQRRLDHDYTVFAYVSPANGEDTIDGVIDGATIRTIQLGYSR